MFGDYLFYTDEFLEAHQLDFNVTTKLLKFEDKEENEDAMKIFGPEKKFIPDFKL